MVDSSVAAVQTAVAVRPGACLTAADGYTWRIVAADRHATIAVQSLSGIMRLPSVRSSGYDLLVCGSDAVTFGRARHGAPVLASQNWPVRYLGDGGESLLPVSIGLLAQGSSCLLRAPVGASVSRLHVFCVAQCLARLLHERGGLLLHGALTEFGGAGVVLAGPSGVGKTTASNRFSPPWRSLSDDAALIVKGADGRYWAHPWPTWSRLRLNGEVHHSWDVQRAVPLAAVCFLSQSEADGIAPMGGGCAAGLLAQSAEEAAVFMPYTSVADRREKRVQRLDNACALSRSVPSYQLELSRTGTFWHLLEDVLSAGARGLSPSGANRPAAAGV